MNMALNLSSCALEEAVETKRQIETNNDNKNLGFIVAGLVGKSKNLNFLRNEIQKVRFK